MDGFYLERWDTNNLARRVDKRTQRVAKKPGSENTVVTLATGLDVDRRRPVCEIKCGWGGSLEHLLADGFSTTIGTEVSAHRAATVRAGLGVCVLTGAFEPAATQRELVARAPVRDHLVESCPGAHLLRRRGDRSGHHVSRMRAIISSSPCRIRKANRQWVCLRSCLTYIRLRGCLWSDSEPGTDTRALTITRCARVNWS